MRSLQRLVCVAVLLFAHAGCTQTVVHTRGQESAPSPKSIDIAELVEIFYGRRVPHGSTHFWSTGALPGTPIEWETEGVGNCDGFNCRRGSVIATIGGEPTHRTLKKYLVPGRWQITMTGSNAGFSEVEFEPDDSMHSDRVHDLVSYVADRIPLTPHRCTRPNAEGWYSSSAIFRIERDDIPPAWLAFSNSSGSSGHHIEMTLYNIERHADAFECFYERVGAELWPPQFRAGWTMPPEIQESPSSVTGQTATVQDEVTEAIEELIRNSDQSP